MEYKPLYPTNDYSNINDLFKNSYLNLTELERISNSQPEDSILYRYFRVQVADGYTYYQVIKVNKKTCKIKICDGIDLDNYLSSYFDNGGDFPLGIITKLVKKQQELNDLFKK
jgi:hypothetical protein